ncbi:PREDICTED: NECAP-like protein CG9132 [Amphimedon queenslandica]|uniref:NECAP PHear domain-containing protein n=1 Tax=Amphimedon queenslandica TaxID=400682 RepID=A0A1X7US13_AMPQE|nr:PREDICTED: NECAP-like protein CG9132 [Amphimedon queenslandica]|eukprot:XP_019852765.1 PREDICTED: NECAP-like protein CG9132 [Amphimedon queenslandica]
MAEEYESIQLVKQEAFIYQIPPRVSTTRAVRAADWNLAAPDFKGRLKIVSKKNECFIKLEDRSGELFAVCPVDSFPGLAVEPVSDSSRYFVLRLKDPSGRHAFVGLGFQDRGDAFDFNVSLMEHFKGIKRDEKIAKEETEPKLTVDYSLKQGEKISVNIGAKLKLGADDPGAKDKPLIGLSAAGGLLPPPVSSSRPVKPPTVPAPSTTSGSDDWGDFFSATATGNSSTSSSGNTTSGTNSSGGGGWVQF